MSFTAHNSPLTRGGLREEANTVCQQSGNKRHPRFIQLPEVQSFEQNSSQGGVTRIQFV